MDSLITRLSILTAAIALAGLHYLSQPLPSPDVTLQPEVAAKTPAPAATGSASGPEIRTVQLSPEARRCLVKNLYWEARGEDYKGMRAVAQVTLNRVKADQWPDTVCGVVRQPKQFSWTHQIAWDRPLRDSKAKTKAEHVVGQVAATGYASMARDGTWAHHYVRHDIEWRYAKDLRHLDDVGAHRFYS